MTNPALKNKDLLSLDDAIRGDLSGLRGHEWEAVYDALFMVTEGLRGICSQPRCGSGIAFNTAGDYLDRLNVFLEDERERLVETIRSTKPVDAIDAEIRSRTLLRHVIAEDDLSDELLRVLTAMQKAA